MNWFLRTILRFARVKFHRFFFGRKRGRGKAALLFRRLRPWVMAASLALSLGGFALLVSKQTQIFCSMLSPGHWLAGRCGDGGVEGFPTSQELKELKALPPGDCDALRLYKKKKLTSATRKEVEARLARNIGIREAHFTPSSRPAVGRVRQSENPFPTTAAAEQDARRRVGEHAAGLGCAPNDEYERLLGVDVTGGTFDCDRHPAGGRICGFQYEASCRMEMRKVVTRCE